MNDSKTKLFWIPLLFFGLFYFEPLYSQDGIEQAERLQSDEQMRRNIQTILDAHLRKYNQRASKPLTSDEAQKKLADFNQKFNTAYDSSAASSFASHEDINWGEQSKFAFEQVAKSIGKDGSALVYNRDAQSVYNAVCDGRANCWAGTDLFIGNVISKWRVNAIENGDLVVIFSNGHIQPGIFTQDSKGKWRLKRLETTGSSFRGEDLGPASELAHQGPLRILMADDYLNMEANRINGFPTQQIVDEQLPKALDRVKKKYGVPVGELEALIKKQHDLSRENNIEANEGTPLAFGKVDVPPGDLARLNTIAPMTHRIPSFQKPDSKILLHLPRPISFDRKGIAAIYVSADQTFWGDTPGNGTVPIKLEDAIEALEELLRLAKKDVEKARSEYEKNRILEAQQILKKYEAQFGPISYETDPTWTEIFYYLTDEYKRKLEKVEKTSDIKQDAEALLNLITPKTDCK